MATVSLLWQRVNSLGGVPHTEYERGANDTVGLILPLIEENDALVATLRSEIAELEANVASLRAQIARKGRHATAEAA